MPKSVTVIPRFTKGRFTGGPQKFKIGKSRKRISERLDRRIKKAMDMQIETKSGVITGGDNVEILHNNFITRTTNLIKTNQNINDAETGTGGRVGDKINLRGVSIKAMFELNERYSDVTMRILVIRSAKGDTPTFSTLWNGASRNKMIDTIDIERYTVIAGKTFKLKSGNQGAVASGTQTIGGGYVNLLTPTYSKSTRIIKMWIPGKKFSKNGIIQYENGQEQVKFFDYHLLYYAYSNYATAEVGGLPPTSYFVASVNDEVIKLYYKDA